MSLSHLFQRELSIIDFTLNYPPIRNNITSASLLSMLIETDYLNYPPIRNNLTSASLLSMIIEMDYNLLGRKAPAMPCLATCVSGSLPYFLTVDYWNICPGCIFTRIHGTDDS